MKVENAIGISYEGYWPADTVPTIKRFTTYESNTRQLKNLL
jgi:hypothetical protein